ncbi:YybH family protein [Bowmanella dokdonensis]|uniref:DUF4440 domain-containing protein n=1 Tax=Bowmanella dokdonensis TaxID=751969 RepID=A0A939DPH7_9ALTE|nr:DUF4440 domain-containing protein [Bowmanella dokdonensis]MBN7826385.1 DUF4440 domain-containing protein [Bowmanella dokdonensis]
MSLSRTTSLLLSLACLISQPALAQDTTVLASLVSAREQAFADSMANRDFEQFQRFLSEDAIFYAGPAVLRGKQQVAEGWQQYYQGEEAPFSWLPRQVEVLASGDLAHSSGPVLDKDGKCIATFNSIWRLEQDGQWRVVFDKGSPACE